MDVNIILSYLRNEGGIRRFYSNALQHVTINEAAKEPLKLRDLIRHEHRVPLPSGKAVDLGTAILYTMVESVENKYRGRSKLQENDRMYICKMMCDSYPDWSIMDVRCFDDMLINSRLPTNTYGAPVYEMVSVDIPTLLGKAEVYDKMRPTGTVYQGNSPKQEAEVKELDEWHKTHLLNHMEYDFAVPYEDWVQGYTKPSGDPVRNAERYWRARPNYDNDEYDREGIDAIMAKIRQVGRTLAAPAQPHSLTAVGAECERPGDQLG